MEEGDTRPARSLCLSNDLHSIGGSGLARPVMACSGDNPAFLLLTLISSQPRRKGPRSRPTSRSRPSVLEAVQPGDERGGTLRVSAGARAASGETDEMGDRGPGPDDDVLAGKLADAGRRLSELALPAAERARLHRKFITLCDAMKVHDADRAAGLRRLDAFLSTLDKAAAKTQRNSQ
jgi:hypothetical protein